MSLLLLFAKRHARLVCSLVNALATACCRYHLFASVSAAQTFLWFDIVVIGMGFAPFRFFYAEKPALSGAGGCYPPLRNQMLHVYAIRRGR